MLARRQRSTELTTISYGSLCGAGEFLVWLQGDHRAIPNDASVYLPAFEEYGNEVGGTGFSQSTTIVGWPSASPYAVSAPEVYRRLEEYIELELFMGKRVSFPELMELGLLSNSLIQLVLRGLPQPEERVDRVLPSEIARNINRESL